MSCAGWRIASERAGVGFAGGVKNLLVGCRATSQGLECAEAEGMRRRELYGKDARELESNQRG